MYFRLCILLYIDPNCKIYYIILILISNQTYTFIYWEELHVTYFSSTTYIQKLKIPLANEVIILIHNEQGLQPRKKIYEQYSYIFNIQERLGSAFDVRAEEALLKYQLLFSVIDDGFIRLRFSFLAAFLFMRLGQIGCGRQIPRFKVLSWHHQGSVWLRACNQRAFRIGKRQPLHYFLRNADGTTQVDFRIDRLARSSRVTPLDACTRVVSCLGCAQRTQVYLKLMIIHVNLQLYSCTEDRISINASQVSGIIFSILKSIFSQNLEIYNITLCLILIMALYL
ncbi:Hypothetical_protein [Hexamita inflata]|uniref:Hypothetical_protein n=1 Tax=Hexamita inflata TaxID=28002 RepID=A0AA86RDH4_9EUKA|nr:Hypothetical protein HINF_LOCUS58703 [Hexamita inflata]